MAEQLVEVVNLSYTHGHGEHEQRVLDSVTLSLNSGEVVVLTGPSGSGKSTLLTIVGGLRSARNGSVNVMGTEVVAASEDERVRLRRRIGFIFQHHNLAPALTVGQNIQMGLQLSDTHRAAEAAGTIQAAAENVGIAEHLHKLPRQLSGGQLQRAGIARALVNQPRLILADEPTASLDKKSGQLVLKLFDDMAQQGSAVVLVTHDKRIVEQADRVLMLEEGVLVPPAERIMQEAGASLRTLFEMDSSRLGRMMSFAHALARVAVADGRTDPSERAAIADALAARRIFSGTEIELIVSLALAQAQAWSSTVQDPGSRGELAKALEAVAAADSTVTDEERLVIRELLGAAD